MRGATVAEINESVREALESTLPMRGATAKIANNYSSYHYFCILIMLLFAK